jgi:peptide/nickel transport system ATP-binding protein
MTSDRSIVLEVNDLSTHFRGSEGTVRAVQNVSFDLASGETLCLLGESGCGKTVTMRSLMRLLPRTATITGAVRLDGVDVLSLDRQALPAFRGSRVAMIFQDPMAALDSVYTIGAQIVDVIAAHGGVRGAAAWARALELLELVQVPSAKRRLEAYPHELSGGLRQRAMIAMALSCRPKLLLADEPTTALDATVQIQILLLLRELQKTLGMAMIMVTHDLGVACETADRVAVMYAGRIVETAGIDELMNAPRHPYTIGLLGSTVGGLSRGDALKPIPGSPPDLSNLPAGCSFAPRCPHTMDRCKIDNPTQVQLTPHRTVRCHLIEQGRPPGPDEQSIGRSQPADKSYRRAKSLRDDTFQNPLC